MGGQVAPGGVQGGFDIQAAAYLEGGLAEKFVLIDGHDGVSNKKQGQMQFVI